MFPMATCLPSIDTELADEEDRDRDALHSKHVTRSFRDGDLRTCINAGSLVPGGYATFERIVFTA
jgi:hypothetical protein